jgi:hypothetical protein
MVEEAPAQDDRSDPSQVSHPERSRREFCSNHELHGTEPGISRLDPHGIRALGLDAKCLTWLAAATQGFLVFLSVNKYHQDAKTRKKHQESLPKKQENTNA